MRSINTLRRFLLTVANIIQAKESMAQAIGSWEKVPSGEGPRKGRAHRPMSLHYSAEHALSSGRAKLRVLGFFLRAAKKNEDV